MTDIERAPLTKAQAQALTEKIRQSADAVWVLLLEARDRSAWEALGYAGWGEYVETEFQMSRGNASRLINQGQVKMELAAAARVPVTELPTITARTATAIAPVADKVARKIEKATAGKRPAQRAAVASSIIDAESRVARARQDETPAESASDPPTAAPEIIIAILGTNPGVLARQCTDPRKVARDLKRYADQFEVIAYGLAGAVRAQPPARDRSREMVTSRFKG